MRGLDDQTAFFCDWSVIESVVECTRLFEMQIFLVFLSIVGIDVLVW